MDRDYAPTYNTQPFTYNEPRTNKINKDNKYALPNFPEFDNATNPARAPPNMSAYRRFVLIIHTLAPLPSAHTRPRPSPGFPEASRRP